jgi:ubiquinone/menaquinone biosynthesis C-methylase UbiE
MGDFDSDTAALIERANLNAGRTEHDLERWIFEHVQPADGMRILDLGCGTGKQLFALAERLSAGSELVGVDISEQAVEAVNQRARREGLTNVRALRASLDECPGALPSGRFHLVLSTYAIYYASDVVGLLGELASVLRPGGQVFVCGPGSGTNQEMVALVNALDDGVDDAAAAVEDFLNAAQIAALQEHYRSVSVTRMNNAAVFRSADEVLAWWRHHNMYVAAADDQVRRRLESIFASGAGTFRLTKNVLGVHCRA